jgi:hypothetical protein
MCIEERIEELENLTKAMTEKIEYLESVNHDKWVSVKELADIMGCSANNIYIKIRSGEIYATFKLGSIPRIPLSQFYQPDRKALVQNKKNSVKELSIKEKVFG